MWECPEFFALDGGHALIYSTLGKVFWQSGVLDESTMKFTVKKTGLLDLDAFYAPKTQRDAHGRRILWGWVPERRSDAAMREAGWSGMMSLPRVMNLDKDGTLRLTMLPELRSLRGSRIAQSESRAGSLYILPQAKGEAFVHSAGTVSDFVLSLKLPDGAELMDIHYAHESRTFTVGGKEIKLEAGDEPTIHAYVDGSVVEVILGERIGYTKRFYFSQPTAPDVHVLLTGGPATLEAWNVQPISKDRLTS
jgi:beta-fructofuranosidase